jgi:signal peptidase II
MPSDPHASEEGAASGATESVDLRRRVPVMLGVALAVLVVDQLTKWWALENLVDGPIDLVWTLRLNLVFNRGASFSLGDGFGPLIGVVALGVVVVLLWTGRTMSSLWGSIALGLVLGWALGNLVDRAFRSTDGFMGGAVIDFIDFRWYPVFNVADAGVVVGAILLMLVSYRRSD